VNASIKNPRKKQLRKISLSKLMPRQRRLMVQMIRLLVKQELVLDKVQVQVNKMANRRIQRKRAKGNYKVRNLQIVQTTLLLESQIGQDA